LYEALVGGFTATLPGGLNELALLMGNIAHESGSFIYTEEILCKGVNQVTASCPYGWYHGRGYIQLSWDYNYRDAAAVLGMPEILTNPDIVMNNPAVNWATVQWFWTSRVQPTFGRRGYTLGASVRAINGGIECDQGPISSGRVSKIQCFQRNFGLPVDFNTQCPAMAMGDSSSEFAGNTSQNQQIPAFAVGLVVVGTLLLILAIVVIALLAILGKKTRVEEKV
jgi:hypothetical protein